MEGNIRGILGTRDRGWMRGSTLLYLAQGLSLRKLMLQLCPVSLKRSQEPHHLGKGISCVN